MARQDPAPWLRAALLLLWVPGCLSLSGPRTVRGTVGGSLSVQCQYEEEFKRIKKYWCGSPCSILKRNKIVETTGSERKVRNGRVSIRDHPANLTFTVTLENLTEDDGGAYGCGINVPWSSLQTDPTFEVVVIVSPAPTPALPSRATAKTRTTTTNRTTTTTAQITTLSTVKMTVKATHGPNGQENSPQSQGLPVLLSLLGLLLFLLVGASLLAWWMVRRRIKADKNPEPLQNHEAAQQSEPCYANLELQTWALLEEPEPPAQVEVEYSTVKAPQEDPQYATVTFSSRNQDAKDSRAPSQRPPQPEPEYSEIRKNQA
ncbi:CMRF35-like molecule 8 isoform X2 [Phyllostomus hastatus]|uniref:CMRF35-like molecule 8 isoform X2 n=1 Tax=Phyllostomus hastatus TaxID=9423 RepID=UPI001E683449|nr:CMRF35-like molecule 8 isoform X2 [Phyllostomus hastatus]